MKRELSITTENPESLIPKAVVNRLSLYLRELQQLAAEDKQTISSSELARRLAVTASQVRKDFAYFGQFGYPGLGYRCHELIAQIKKILGTDRIWPVALIGCGNLGQALLGYRGFDKQGFRVVAAFDSAPDIVGRRFENLTVQHINNLADAVNRHKIQLAILAVPANAAVEAAETVVAAGVTGIMNFAPVMLKLPPKIDVVRVDLAMELEQLTFSVVKKAKN